MTTVSAVEPDALLLELIATPEGRADPYPRYAALRERAPVHRSAFGIWTLTDYDDCQLLLRHPGVGKDFSSAMNSLGLSDADREAQDRFRNDRSNMLVTDPPDHTRLRGLVTRAFTPRTVEKLRPTVVTLVDELLDAFDGEVEVMDALAFPLPVTVIGDMLGVPVEDRPLLRPLVRSVTAILELAVSPEALAEAAEADATLGRYFAELVADRRAHPRDDLLTKLIAAEDQGDQLSEHELISTVILLFAAGFETTTHLIGNGLLALLRNPGELERLRADRSLIRSGVEELLRYDSPVQIAARTTYEELPVGGQTVPSGNLVLAMLGAANRDPARFTDPDRLDVGRDEGAPMSFGGGIHFCLGAALARLEGQIVLDRLLDRFRTMELVGGPPAVRDSLTLRGLTDLRVRFGA
ncbi:MAG TPA: cytochrome P450 [Acidimicrobiales bacterium]|jgi:cytochrome P450|nr:cytochrome P450 [Acidimicrobiales bacterium]